MAQENGRPLTKESFGNWFGEACKVAGLKGYNAHGLRKLAAIRLALNGATVPQLNAVFGWKGSKMATYYIEQADRTRLAASPPAALASTRSQRHSSRCWRTPSIDRRSIFR